MNIHEERKNNNITQHNKIIVNIKCYQLQMGIKNKRTFFAKGTGYKINILFKIFLKLIISTM